MLSFINKLHIVQCNVEYLVVLVFQNVLYLLLSPNRALPLWFNRTATEALQQHDKIILKSDLQRWHTRGTGNRVEEGGALY